MATRDLTDKFLANLIVEKRTEFTDARQIGLELHAYPTGKKTFSFRMRGPDQKFQRAKIGQYPDVKLAAARAKAAEYVRLVRDGAVITAAAKKEEKAFAAEELASTPTLEELLREYEAQFSHSLGIWRRTKRGFESDAFKRISSVYGRLLETKVTELTERDLFQATTSYVPKSGKTSANGQVSRARLYLKPVLDWASHRGMFQKIGLGRAKMVLAPDLNKVPDPASSDPKITGRRQRILDQKDLAAILPLLKWPAPTCLEMRTPPEKDFRPIALRFLLLTGARLGELQAMRWSHFREDIGVWHKPEVKTLKGQKRQQNLPLPQAALDLLRSLPGYKRAKQSDLVFPNASGGKMENWGRITSAISRKSGTSGWHRHDLRRTLSTFLKHLMVPKQVIDDILAHNASHEDDGVSRALGNYLSSQFLGDIIPDPQREALEKMAAVVAKIEAEVDKGLQSGSGDPTACP